MTVTSELQTTIVGKLSNVNKWYGTRRILDDISLEVRAHEIVALVGRSGCGKSTVLRVLAGLSPDHTGNREVAGAPAVAFQEPRLFPWRDVLTNVLYGLNRTTMSRHAARTRSEQALAEIGLADHADAWPLRLAMRALLLDLWRRHGFGVLLVTHDVDEAIELADRVLVLDDGRLAHSISIESPRPTSSERTAQHDQYRVDLLDKLGVRL